jgi:RNA polymerase sigma factor (sigma-70 family)
MGTPTWPPDAPPFDDLVRAYDLLVCRSARRWGIRPVDVPDCAQEVLLRFYRAIVDRRLDVSRPKGIGGWLKKTTRTVARDILALKRTRYEILTTTGAIGRVAGTHNPEDRMAEAADVHEVIDRILDKLPQKQREVFVMSDLEDTPMDEILEELKIPKATAYARLKAAREAFAREWTAMQTGGAVVAPLALLSVHELIAAEHTIADVPPGFTDELLRRLGEELGQDFLGPGSGGAVAAGVGAKLGAAAAAAKAGGITLTVWQIGLGVLLVGIAGAGLTAALRPASAEPGPPAAVTLHAPSPAAPAPPPPMSQAPLPSGGAPADVKSSAPPSSEIQTRLLDNARAMLSNHQPAKALALLARVTAPELVEQRDTLRRLAFAQQPDAGQP